MREETLLAEIDIYFPLHGEHLKKQRMEKNGIVYLLLRGDRICLVHVYTSNLPIGIGACTKCRTLTQ